MLGLEFRGQDTNNYKIHILQFLMTLTTCHLLNMGLHGFELTEAVVFVLLLLIDHSGIVPSAGDCGNMTCVKQ